MDKRIPITVQGAEKLRAELDELKRVKRPAVVAAIAEAREKGDEADIKAARISISSPLARSLIGKFEGDEVTCPAPKGLIHYAIVSVKYL